MFYLTKGCRVRARWYQVNPKASLAGVQTKFSTQYKEVTGKVTHIRGDAPVNPKSVGVWIQPDDGSAEVVVDLKHVVEVLSEKC